MADHTGATHQFQGQHSSGRQTGGGGVGCGGLVRVGFGRTVGVAEGGEGRVGVGLGLWLGGRVVVRTGGVVTTIGGVELPGRVDDGRLTGELVVPAGGADRVVDAAEEGRSRDELGAVESVDAVVADDALAFVLVLLFLFLAAAALPDPAAAAPAAEPALDGACELRLTECVAACGGGFDPVRVSAKAEQVPATTTAVATPPIASLRD